MLQILITAAVIAGALGVMLDMDASSQSQGGRFYVAVGALVMLGALDGLIGGRRDEAPVRLLALVLATVVLVGLAWKLP